MGEMKNICLLGSTGSIGRSSLEVLANFPDRFRVAYLTTHSNIDLLQEQIRRYSPLGVAVYDEAAAQRFRKQSNGSVRLFSGADGLAEIASADDVDIVMNSLVGFAGLIPTVEAIKRGRRIILANKETLVVAGEIITRLVREHHTALIPVDSEHSAILQCLAGEQRDQISRLILTASGGPFLRLKREALETVTVDAALKHPTWRMGNKISIDSATLMNKGLEVIEAHWLFNLAPDRIDVVIHPQSIIHSMVEFVDGSVKAQLGMPDMKIPIQYALTYPERATSSFNRVDFAALREMTFFSPDIQTFECLALAYDALRQGGTAPAVLNAANEIAVDLFLQHTIGFMDIPRLIRTALETVPVVSSPSLGDIVNADNETRRLVRDTRHRIV